MNAQLSLSLSLFSARAKRGVGRKRSKAKCKLSVHHRRAGVESAFSALFMYLVLFPKEQRSGGTPPDDSMGVAVAQLLSSALDGAGLQRERRRCRRSTLGRSSLRVRPRHRVSVCALGVNGNERKVSITEKCAPEEPKAKEVKAHD